MFIHSISSEMHIFEIFMHDKRQKYENQIMKYNVYHILKRKI